MAGFLSKQRIMARPGYNRWLIPPCALAAHFSAALFGKWAQSEGPRKSGFVAALCWATAFLVGALGIQTHQLWLVYLG